MKMKKIMKRICALVLAFVMVTSTAAVTTYVTPQTTEATVALIKQKLVGAVFKMGSKAVYTGLTKATSGLDEDCVFVRTKNMIFRKQAAADKKKQVLTEYCKNMLASVQAVDTNVTETRNYLAGLIAQFESNSNLQNMSNINQQMNVLTNKSQVAWNSYLDYMRAATKYAEDPTDANNKDAVLKYNDLCMKLTAVDFEALMTAYIPYVSTKMAHYDGEGEINTSKTYLYWAYQYSRENMAFDHQRYAFLTDVIDMNMGTIQQIMELHAMYIAKLKDVRENGVQDAVIDASYNLSDSAYDLKVLEYERCMNMGINAVNNIAQQYEDELSVMLQERDLNTAYKLDYRAEENIKYNYTITHSIHKDEHKSCTHKSTASCSKEVMNFYRVGVDGETYLILNQKNDPVAASDLYEEFEADDPKSWVRNIDVRGESVDWHNFLKTDDGKYEAITSLTPIQNMIEESLFNMTGSNLANYLVKGGGLADVGNASNGYVFMNNKSPLIYDYEGSDLFHDPNVYMNATWSTTAMSLKNGGLDGKSMVTKSGFCRESDKGVLIIMEEADDKGFAYKVNKSVTGDGFLYIKVDGSLVENGGTVKSGKTMEIIVSPSDGMTLTSLNVYCKDPVSGDAYVETLSGEGDFEFMQKNDDGTVSYYYTMPYKDCEVKAVFGEKIEFPKAVNLTYKLNGKEGNFVQFTVKNKNGDIILDNSGSHESAEVLGYEELTLQTALNENVKNLNVSIKDASGRVIEYLSGDDTFEMPNEDCYLDIEYTVIEGAGIESDPYLIYDYNTLDYYGELIWNDAIDPNRNASYSSGHFLVTNDIGTKSGSKHVIDYAYALDGDGSFDGQGYTIYNIQSKTETTALFEYVDSDAVLKDLVLYGFGGNDEIKEKGALLVIDNKGIIDGCEVRDSSLTAVSETAQIGGLVHKNHSTGLIINSGVNAFTDLQGPNIGGLVYRNDGAVKNCFSCAELYVVSNRAVMPSLPGVITPPGGGLPGVSFKEMLTPRIGGFVADGDGSGTVAHSYVTVKMVELPKDDELFLPTYMGMDVIYNEDGTKLVNSVTECFYGDGSNMIGLVWSENCNVIKTEVLRSESIPAQWNERNIEGYDQWVCTYGDPTINDKYPCFTPGEQYHVTLDVTGEGSLNVTDESGQVIGDLVAVNELIHVEIAKPENVIVTTLQVTDENGAVLKSFDTESAAFTYKTPAKNIIIKAVFTEKPVLYTVKPVVDGLGTLKITDGNNNDVSSAKAGDTVYVKAIPDEGYGVAALELRDLLGNVITTFEGSEASFVMEEQDYEVYAKFEEVDKTFIVTAVVNGNGTAEVMHEDSTPVQGGVKAYENIIVAVKPGNGFYPVSFTVTDADGNEVDKKTGDWADYLRYRNVNDVYTTSFTIPESDCTVTVTFEPMPTLFKVTIETEGDGVAGIDPINGSYFEDQVTAGTELSIYAAALAVGGKIESAAAYAEDGTKLEDLVLDMDYESTYEEKLYRYTTPGQNVVIKFKFTGYGELEDTDGDGWYEIDSYEDLVCMAKMVRLYPETYADAKYRQICNINCGMKPWMWEIGTEEVPFEGIYEGYDYYIMGLRARKNSSGLFGVIGTKGIVRNLYVVDFDYTDAPVMASGFAGINRGTILNCGSGVNLTSGGSIFLYGNNTPVPLYSLDSDIKAAEIAGGLVAVNEGTIKNSRSSANVTVAETLTVDSYAGGIAAKNSGEIKNVFQTGKVSGADVAGAIAGYNEGTIQYGYNNETVSGTEKGSITGKSKNTEVKDFWYADNMSRADGTLADSAFTNLNKMVRTDMATDTFAAALNTAIKDTDLTPWTQKATANEGFPRIESAVVVQRTITIETDASASNRASASQSTQTEATVGSLTISGRIHPDAKLMLVRLTESDPEYALLKGSLKDGKFAEGWKLALVYDDGTYAVWEGPLTIKVTPEQVKKLKELKMVYYDINGKHEFPNVKIEGDSLIINVDNIGSFALAKNKDIVKPGNGNNTNNGGLNTGDSAVIMPYIAVMIAMAAVMTVVVLYTKKKRGNTYE